LPPTLKLALAVLALQAIGCTSPQSGLIAKEWCQSPSASVLLVDDMEDGDGTNCARTGGWTVEGAGSLTPEPGAVAKAADVIDLRPMTATMSTPSFRAMYLSGTTAASAALVVSVGSLDIKDYQQILFWARSDNSSINLQISLVTESSAATGDYFSTPATISSMYWGVDSSNQTPNFASIGALVNSSGASIDPGDAVSAIRFQFTAPTPTDTAFGFWIDDVQLTP